MGLSIALETLEKKQPLTRKCAMVWPSKSEFKVGKRQDPCSPSSLTSPRGTSQQNSGAHSEQLFFTAINTYFIWCLGNVH